MPEAYPHGIFCFFVEFHTPKRYLLSFFKVKFNNLKKPWEFNSIFSRHLTKKDNIGKMRQSRVYGDWRLWKRARDVSTISALLDVALDDAIPFNDVSKRYLPLVDSLKILSNL